MTRRGFTAAGAAAAFAARRRIRLGAPVSVKSDDPRELAREHRRLGYAAAYCPKVSLGEAERIRAIEAAFIAEDVAIAEVGAWVNMLDADAARRRANIEYVITRLALAEAVGARCCVDIAGSYNRENWDGPHPKNFSREFFDATVANCRAVIDAVKPKRTRFSIEMMGWAIPDSADSYLLLIKAVDRPAFAAHIDVCNGISSPARFYNNGDFIRECFRKLGPWIVSCHAKDLAGLPGGNTRFVEVIPGRGMVDYRAYLTELASLPGDAPLMLEHLKTFEEYEEGKQYIQRIAAECGVEFA